MYRLPETSTARLHASNEAAVASPPSPLNPEVPLPAIVLMSPTVSTLRIRLFRRSAMYTLPAGSTATPLGPFNDAEVAGPPSPSHPSLPLPAIVLMIPSVLTLLIQSFPQSAM